MLPLADMSGRPQAARAITLPQFVTDDDMLLDAARHQAEQERVAVIEPQEGLRVRAGLLSSEEQRMVHQLFKLKAVGDSFVDTLSLQEYNAPVIQSLVERGLVLAETDDFGEVTLALSSAMRLSTLVSLTQPVVFCRHQGDLRNPAGRNKLGWLKALLDKGWKLTRNKPDWRLKGAQKVLPPQLIVMLLRPT